MNKVEKFLTDKGILYEADDYAIMRGAENDWSRKLVTITDQFIVTVMYSAVLDPEFQLFDRNTYKMIAQQNVLYADSIFRENPWESYVWFE